MDDLSINKIQISGTTLSSILHRFNSSSGDIHGLLFGHVSFSTTTSFSDDSSAVDGGDGGGQTLTATVTNFLAIPSHFPLPLLRRDDGAAAVVGWFSGRRKTPLRPSLKESMNTTLISSCDNYHFTPQNSPYLLTMPPSLFLLLTSPLQEQMIHTHEYRMFQYRVLSSSFEPKSLDIVNIGPSFRSHYGAFSPISPLPLMSCDLRGDNAMIEDEKVESLVGMKRGLMKDQKELDLCAEGFDIGRLNKLMGSDSSSYTAELEHLYDKMLVKLDSLARSVESSSAKVLEQENHNMKLRYKVAGLE